ncbi:hypothetical protein Q8F57_003260 [Paraburkholderia terrae]|uniref:hypothetical protein n=1 Tax=Paraburkholderia terrae TaxID=311230 RepID=UPI00296AABCE|nr:hypothetical protein [Paraburkholderia terrae]MDW3655456.1 hypothetical protein [Paraburkholderia terrae]
MASDSAATLDTSGKPKGKSRPRNVTRDAEGVTPEALHSGTDGLIGKAALCEALGWSRPTLDRRLDRDASFPVSKRGTRAGGWEFDLAAVRAYLNGDAPRPAVRAAKVEQLSVPKSTKGAPIADDPLQEEYSGAKYTVVPPAGVEPVVHTGEQTARQRRDAVQAEILEDKLRRDRGELVVAEQMRHVLTTMLAKLGQGMDRLPDQLVERLGLPEAAGDTIRMVIDDLRRQMVDETRGLLS